MRVALVFEECIYLTVKHTLSPVTRHSRPRRLEFENCILQSLAWTIRLHEASSCSQTPSPVINPLKANHAVIFINLSFKYLNAFYFCIILYLKPLKLKTQTKFKENGVILLWK